jgi:hypothetical protein
MSRLVKSTSTPLGMDEHATLVVSPFGSFYSVVLLLWVTGVALLLTTWDNLLNNISGE